MNLSIFIDGGARGNPGPAGAGVVIHEGDPTRPIHEGGYFLGHMTNNMAEYNGLLVALKLAERCGATGISIHSDSQLLVRQIQGKYRVQSPSLRPLYHDAIDRLGRFDRWQITHVKRQFNQQADELANRAMDAEADVIVVPMAGQPPKDPIDAETKTPQPDREPSPRCSLRFMDRPGPRCPAPCPAGQGFEFGPITPRGCCIYAAWTALAGMLEPNNRQPTGPTEIPCWHCGVTLSAQTTP